MHSKKTMHHCSKGEIALIERAEESYSSLRLMAEAEAVPGASFPIHCGSGKRLCNQRELEVYCSSKINEPVKHFFLNVIAHYIIVIEQHVSAPRSPPVFKLHSAR